MQRLASPRPDPLSQGLSLYLDLLRVVAALVVFATHLADARLTGGRLDWFGGLELGRDAVVVFFVLSGLIIARAADRPGVTGAGFAFDRATRLWSVALPALLICWGLDRWGAAAAPAYYGAIDYQETGLLATLAMGLTFSNEWWPVGRLIGSNLPYWSLSHEAAYYALFAAAVFLRGPVRVAALTGGAVVAGPGVIAYLPAWAAGVWIWRRLAAGRLPQAAEAWVLAVVPALAAGLAVGLGLGPKMLALSLQLWGLEAVTTMRFGLYAIWGNLLAGLTALHLLGVAALLRDHAARDRRWLRWAAGGTFSLYLVHQPVLHALRVALDGVGETALRDALLAGGTVLACLAFAAAFERTIGAQRRMLRSVLREARGPGRLQA